MSTMIMTNEIRTKRRKSLLYTVIALALKFGLYLEHFWTTNDSKSASYEPVVELKKAMRTLRMAAMPGETYEMVAARIDKEAARYRLFLQNPQPIRKIALNVKQFDFDDGNGGYSREQYQVLDPSEGRSDKAEGRASIRYTYNRSISKVLEFFVHDENDEPLFPIARTYTNWIGHKSFDLGLGRTFYLKMVEGDHGYVNVEAGFLPAEPEKVTGIQTRREALAAVGARIINRAKGASTSNLIFSPQAMRFPVLIGFQFLVVSVICGSVISWAITRSQAVPTSGEAFATAALAPSLYVEVENPSLPMAGKESARVLRVSETSGETGDRPNFASRKRDWQKADRNLMVKATDAGRAKRLADVRELRVSVDRSSCKEVRCQQLLASIQKKVESKLGGLNLPVPPPDPSAADNQLSANLVVSYEPVDVKRGQVLLTLFDSEGTLWDGEHDFSYEETDESLFVNAYSDQASWEIVKEIFLAREYTNSDSVEKGVETSTSK